MVEDRYFVGRASPDADSPEPDEINNYSLLKRASSVAQLQPGAMLKRDFEAVPVNVFTALQSWYGGGPAVCRSVVRGLRHAGGVPREHVGFSGPSSTVPRPLLELRVYTCDSRGRAVETYPRELLCSAVSTVASVIDKCQADPSKARLWNYDPRPDCDWRQQRVLTPELRLRDVPGLRNEDCILLEVSLPDGAWPKSQLHAQLGGSRSMALGAVDVCFYGIVMLGGVIVVKLLPWLCVLASLYRGRRGSPARWTAVAALSPAPRRRSPAAE